MDNKPEHPLPLPLAASVLASQNEQPSAAGAEAPSPLEILATQVSLCSGEQRFSSSKRGERSHRGGEPDRCKGFLMQCGLYFTYRSSLSPERKIAYVLSRLTSKALEWGTALMKSESALLADYDAFVMELREVFHHPRQGSACGTGQCMRTEPTKDAPGHAACSRICPGLQNLGRQYRMERRGSYRCVHRKLAPGAKGRAAVSPGRGAGCTSRGHVRSFAAGEDMQSSSWICWRHHPGLSPCRSERRPRPRRPLARAVAELGGLGSVGECDGAEPSGAAEGPLKKAGKTEVAPSSAAHSPASAPHYVGEFCYDYQELYFCVRLSVITVFAFKPESFRCVFSMDNKPEHPLPLPLSQRHNTATSIAIFLKNPQHQTF
ncbi:uncharacterized protein LOC143514995 [Brachyhypopomus gauderio]|uniref:uncharacterized protein LOC143514995 n=1 Tax=Brachyhypopomus gauderio TaxID=698409 RepID=UPI0040431102